MCCVVWFILIWKCRYKSIINVDQTNTFFFYWKEPQIVSLCKQLVYVRALFSFLHAVLSNVSMESHREHWILHVSTVPATLSWCHLSRVVMDCLQTMSRIRPTTLSSFIHQFLCLKLMQVVYWKQNEAPLHSVLTIAISSYAKPKCGTSRGIGSSLEVCLEAPVAPIGATPSPALKSETSIKTALF